MHLFRESVGVHALDLQNARGTQMTTSRNQCPPSTTQAPGIKLRSSATLSQIWLFLKKGHFSGKQCSLVFYQKTDQELTA